MTTLEMTKIYNKTAPSFDRAVFYYMYFTPEQNTLLFLC